MALVVRQCFVDGKEFPPITAGAVLKVDSFGTITADGTEQTVVDKISTTPFKATLEVDLSNLGLAADEVLLKEYLKVSPTGVLRMSTLSDFLGPQAEPIPVTFKKDLCYEYKVTLQQTGGVNRTFDYVFLVEA